MTHNKNRNYEILNLLGYGLAKFDKEFIMEFGFHTKTDFYNFFVKQGLVETQSVVKNRMDLFDPFFDNGRKGWWQKGNTYIHRKELIDSLFGQENVKNYASIVKLFLKEKYNIKSEKHIGFDKPKPIIQSRYRKMQETGLEAEIFFMNNYTSIDMFKNGKIEDARLYGDGYDFQIDVNKNIYLTEVKGVRDTTGKFRLTEIEYHKAQEYKDDYIITLVLNLNDKPNFLTIANPIKELKFEERVIKSKEIKEYHSMV